MRTTYFWTTPHQVRLKSKVQIVESPNYSKVFGSYVYQTIGSTCKQNSQNRLRSPMPEGGEH